MTDNEVVEDFLFEAIDRNDFGLVEDTVNLHGLLNCEAWGPDGYALLCRATLMEREEIAKFLIQKGAKLNYENCSDLHLYGTALHHAVRKGSSELVETILSTNAMFGTQSRGLWLFFFRSLLEIAVERGNALIVKLILNEGTNYSTGAKFDLDETVLSEPLFNACCRGLTEMAELLLNWRAEQKFSDLQPLHAALILASNKGNEEIVSALLTAGADPSTVVESQVIGHWNQYLPKNIPTPLHLACIQGHVGVVKLLLESGAEPNCPRQEDSLKAIHLACIQGNIEIVSHLLNIGVDPNSKAENQFTALHSVAKFGYSKKEIVELLLNSGASINAQTSKGSTPLILAIKYGRVVVAEILIERGADVTLKDNFGNTPLQVAFKKRSPLIKHLLQCNHDIDDELKKSIIDTVIHCVNLFDIDAFFEYDDIFSREDLNDPALFSAGVRNGHKHLVKRMLSHGLDRNEAIIDPTQLHDAVEWGNIKIIELLLKSGYDINATDDEGNTPIYYSMSCWDRDKWPEIFQTLLTSGAEVENVPTFLHEAIEKDCFGICKLLIETFAPDINALNTEGDTPLEIIVSKVGYYGSNYRVEDLGEVQNQKIIAARADITKLLLSSGANIDLTPDKGITALHVAAQNGNLEALKILLHFGADVNARRDGYIVVDDEIVERPLNDGETSLHCAAGRGFAEIVKILLKFDADIDAVASRNRTALHCAYYGNHEEVVQVLLEHGCDINIENDDGKTVLNLTPYDNGCYVYLDDDCDDLDDLNDPDNYAVVTNMLKMHAMKRKVARLHINEKIEQIINLDSTLVSFQEECEEELSKIKSVKLCCHLTLYDVLVDSKNPAYVKDESLRQALESLNFDDYPIYKSLVVSNIEKNKRRTELLTSGLVSLNIIVKTSNGLNGNEWPILLNEVLEEIVSNLTNWDLKHLIAASESIKNQVCK